MTAKEFVRFIEYPTADQLCDLYVVICTFSENISENGIAANGIFHYNILAFVGDSGSIGIASTTSFTQNTMKQHGKKYRSALEKLGGEGVEHTLADAVKLVKETSSTKFDSTIEIHIRTGCDPKYADQLVRATLVLPNGTGKTKKIAVFTDDSHHKEAKAAGADIVGGEELIDEVAKGKIDFELAIATPDMMKSMAKIAKILGPKGLMPSPKSGTVTTDITKTLEEVKKGKIEFKIDKQGIIHTILGKASFDYDKLLENTTAFFKALKDARPAGIKGQYLYTITLKSTMGPGIRVLVNDAMGQGN